MVDKGGEIPTPKSNRSLPLGRAGVGPMAGMARGLFSPFRPNSLGGKALSLYRMFAKRLRLQAEETSRNF